MKFPIRAALALTLAASLVPVALPIAQAASPKKPGVSASAGAPQTNPLGLTVAQQKKLQAIDQKARAEITVIQKGKGTDKEKQAKAFAIMKKYSAQADAVLTPAQKKKLNQMKAMQAKAGKQQEAAMKKMQANNEAVQKSLTPAQKKKLDAIRLEFQAKLSTLEKNTKLTDAQKRDQAQVFFKQADQKVKAVLTAKQKAMLQRK